MHYNFSLAIVRSAIMWPENHEICPGVCQGLFGDSCNSDTKGAGSSHRQAAFADLGWEYVLKLEQVRQLALER